MKEQHTKTFPPAVSRRGEIDPFIVMDIMSAAAELEVKGCSIIHMEVGQPGTPAPRKARENAQRMLECDALGYTLALGLPELRERIAVHYETFYNISVAPERIVVTSGSSAGFVLSFLALFDAGERVALPSPGYPCYRHILSTVGIEPVIIETSDSQRWMPQVQDLDDLNSNEGPLRNEKLKGLLLASPANPTGTMLVDDGLQNIAEACDRHGIWFISDEIYHGLNYDVPARTALQYSENAVVINSFSKYFSMTGWRIGWMVVPSHLVRTIERLAQNFYICPTTISQYAALGAFDGIEELEEYKAVYAENRHLLLNELPTIGFTKILPADGAFYIYIDVSDYTDNSADYVNRMLREVGVATTPGLDFDSSRGHHFVRLSYAGTTPDMVEAVKRLRSWNGK